MVLSSRRPGRNSKLQQIPLPEILRQGSFLFQAEGLALFRAKGSIPIGRGGHARAFFPHKAIFSKTVVHTHSRPTADLLPYGCSSLRGLLLCGLPSRTVLARARHRRALRLCHRIWGICRVFCLRLSVSYLLTDC